MLPILSLPTLDLSIITSRRPLCCVCLVMAKTCVAANRPLRVAETSIDGDLHDDPNDLVAAEAPFIESAVADFAPQSAQPQPAEVGRARLRSPLRMGSEIASRALSRTMTPHRFRQNEAATRWPIGEPSRHPPAE
jgi:hypothetical protein